MPRGRPKVVGRRSVNPEPKLRLPKRLPPEESSEEENNNASGEGGVAAGGGGKVGGKRGRSAAQKMDPNKMFKNAKRYHALKQEILAPFITRLILRHRLDEFLEEMDSEMTVFEPRRSSERAPNLTLGTVTADAAVDSSEGEEEGEGEEREEEKENNQQKKRKSVGGAGEESGWNTDEEAAV